MERKELSVGGSLTTISTKEPRFLEKSDRIKPCRGTENCLLRPERDCRHLCVYTQRFRGLTGSSTPLTLRWRAPGFGEHSTYRGGNTVLLSSCRKKRHFGNAWPGSTREDAEILSALEAAPPKMLMLKIPGLTASEDLTGIFTRLRKNNLKISNMYAYTLK